MKQARCNAPLALIKDRFILAISGMTGRLTTTKSCEAYDTLTNYWFPICEAPVPLFNTSAVVMNSRFVYVLPGSNRECKRGSAALLLHTLDTGASRDYSSNVNDRNYGAHIASQRWSQLLVSNPEYVLA